MKVRSLLEASPSSRYFEVVDSFPIFHGGGFFNRSQKSQTQPGDEIHAIPGGNFLIRDGRVVQDGFTPLTDPDSSEATHHEYRNSVYTFNNKRFNSLVKRGSIEELPQNRVTSVQYR